MSDAVEKLRGLILSAADLRQLTQGIWPDALIEDYLNILDNLVTVAEAIGEESEKTIEETPTNFADNTIPVALSNRLVSDVANLYWDISTRILGVGGIIISSGRRKSVVRVSSTPYTVSRTNEVIYVDASFDVDINLLSGIDGEQHRIINSGTSGNIVTINPNGLETIFGESSVSVYNGEVFDISYETTEGWY